MYLERLLQIHVAAFAVLGAMVLGGGQRDLRLVLIVGAAAAVSLLVTDLGGWFRLHRTISNLAALVAVALALRETLRYEGYSQLLVIANLLVFLQVVLFFQQKDERIYWQLIMLSLLEVVVAALFSQGVWFGLLIIIHLLVGLASLALLLMFRQWRRHQAACGLAPPAAKAPMAAQQAGAADFVGACAGAAHAGIGAELCGRLVGMGAGTVVLALLVFLAVPRFGRGDWPGALITPHRVVGFDEQVTLGALGEIIESRQPVMRVELLLPDRSAHYPVRSALYLRGAVLTRYEAGQWSCDSTWLEPPFRDPLRAPLRRDTLIQRITVEPLERGEVCCLWPFYARQRGTPLDFQLRTRRLLRSPAMRGQRFTFELGTTALADGVQQPLIPCQQNIDPQALLQVPDLPRLAALAAEWDQQSGLPSGDRLGRALALNEQLLRAERFTYSLEGQPRRPELDPIEDFVSEHPAGHCEYFATALVLMLRSRGIPARLVIGYCSDEFDPATQSFRVRQLHAHAWVEAYLEPQHLPAGLGKSGTPAAEDYSRGAWLRLDPTPARARSSPSAAGGLAAAYGWLEDLWRDYVLELDLRRQRTALYEPVLQSATRAVRQLSHPRWWSGRFRQWWQWAGALPLGAAVRLGGLLILGAILAGGVWLLARLARRVFVRLRRAGLVPAGRGPTQAPAAVEFYRRLEALLARQGLVRRAGQTQREFATLAAARLQTTVPDARGGQLLVLVAEAFYQVRFGHQELDHRQAQAVEQALGWLRAALRASAGGARAPAAASPEARSTKP